MVNFDIPNIVTLPIEIGIALMILWTDRRSRLRDRENIERQMEIETRHRDARSMQTERFNNWTQEAAKRQIMLLESIMVSLDVDKAQIFKDEVGTRYSEEISRDLNDLENLLEKKGSDPLIDDFKLDVEIESKIEELSSAKDIASSFLPESVLESLQNLSHLAVNSLEGIQKLTKRDGVMELPAAPSTPTTAQQDSLNEFKVSKTELQKEIANLHKKLKENIDQKTTEIASSFRNMFSSDKIERGLKDLIGINKEENGDEDDET
ncbi:MAG: hypothetical protein ACXAB7_01805 [Candidatus Kariarchaeaceae archaeon]